MDMETADVKEKVRKIIKLELEGASWSEISLRSDEVIEYVVRNNLVNNIDFDIYRYLEDYDIRAHDKAYANFQINNVINKMD